MRRDVENVLYVCVRGEIGWICAHHPAAFSFQILDKLYGMPVKFNKPPVVEVACGVLFKSLPELRTAHIGIFWGGMRSLFPRVQDVAPLDPVIEGAPHTSPKVQVQFANLPPMRRTWLISDDGTNLIQIQEDRFLFNWKRVGDGPYPSYEVVIAKFEDYLSRFSEFLKSEKIGALSYRQFELTYVNLIRDTGGVGELDKQAVLVDHMRLRSESRFLPEPETVNWSTNYLLPSGWGRLRVTAQTANVRNINGKLLKLDFTARGIPPDESESNRRSWFDLAHEWITHGFADSTTDQLHKVWERTS